MKKSPQNQVNKLQKHLLHVSKFPGLYGVNKAEDINMMMLGLSFSSSATDVQSASEFADDFNKYVRKHYKGNVRASILEQIRWPELIRLHSFGTDISTLKIFSDLYLRFLLSKKIEVPEEFLPKPNH